MSLKLEIKEIQGMVRNTIPESHETIADDFDLVKMMPYIKEINYYWRDKQSCPFGRGNLIVDFIFKDDEISCLKFPFEMTEKQIENYLKPILTSSK